MAWPEKVRLPNGTCAVGHRADTGKPIRKKVHGQTREEARGALRELLRKYRVSDAEDGQPSPDGHTMKLKSALEDLLDCKIKTRVGPQTYKLHKQRCEDLIVPYPGDIPVAGLNQYLVTEWFKRLEADGHSADLQNKAGQLLRRCLKHCIDCGVIKSSRVRPGGAVEGDDLGARAMPTSA